MQSQFHLVMLTFLELFVIFQTKIYIIHSYNLQFLIVIVKCNNRNVKHFEKIGIIKHYKS